MRIVHLDLGGELRGGQRQVLLLARGLGERGHGQVLLAPAGSPLLGESLRLGLGARPAGWAALALEARAADLVHAHDARAHTMAVLAAPDRPVVVSRRVAFPVREGLLSRWKYRRAARFLAVSEFVKGRLLEAGVEAARISVVYDGVEMAPPQRPASRSRLVIAPASADPGKGSALAQESCRRAGIELRLSNELERDLAEAALLLYLSECEGLGSAILLAMARGVPVLASRVGGIPELIEHRRTGLLVDNDAEVVAAELSWMLANLDYAAALAVAARAQIPARFSDAIMVAQTEQAYEQVVSHQLSVTAGD